jgi:ParB-like chromosome segregation protein Spo0J
MKPQPLSTLEWVSRDRLHANDYNPNHQAPIEHDLLAQSLLEDGWTQPIVARTDGEIVDGFHRWTLARHPKIAALTDGKVPVVWLDKPKSAQMLATIRHNRARGNHGVLAMAKIVRELIDAHGLTEAELVTRLGMEEEEVERLYDRAPSPEKVARTKETFSAGWVPAKD